MYRPGKPEESPPRSFDRKRAIKLGVFFLMVGVLIYFVSSHWNEFAAILTHGEKLPVIGGGSDPSGEDFFLEFKLEREKMRKEQTDLVKSVIDDERADKDIRKGAYQQYLALSDVMGKELQAEGILEAKGLEAIVFLSGDSCTVVVRKEKLDEKDVKQVGDVIKRVSKIRLENVTVIPSPK